MLIPIGKPVDSCGLSGRNEDGMRTRTANDAPEIEWLTIEDLFPEQKAGRAIQAYRYREDLTQK